MESPSIGDALGSNPPRADPHVVAILPDVPEHVFSLDLNMVRRKVLLLAAPRNPAVADAYVLARKRLRVIAQELQHLTGRFAYTPELRMIRFLGADLTDILRDLYKDAIETE